MARWWTVLGLAVLAVGVARADDDEEGEEEGEERGGRGATAGYLPGVAPVTDPTWASECGSCHLAYAPGLLPQRSWTAILSDLPHHFGEDATVDETTRARLVAVAATQAADVSPYRLSAAIARVTAGTTPTRISTIPALAAEHREEIPASWVVGNPEVRSWAACGACHTRAAQGSFAEREIRIPGHGWAD